MFDGATERAFFDPANNVYYVAADGARRYLYRLSSPEYSIAERIDADRVHYIFSISPDGEWLIVGAPPATGEGMQEVAISTRGLPRRMICSYCTLGAGPARELAPPISWTRDGRTLLVSLQFASQEYWMGPSPSLAVPVRPGAMLPDLPAGGIESVDDYRRLTDARIIPQKNVLPGATSDQLFTYQPTTLRNLYRLRLPD